MKQEGQLACIDEEGIGKPNVDYPMLRGARIIQHQITEPRRQRPDELEKIHGCLAGLAVGDAMGRPTELLLHYRKIERKYGRVEGLVGRKAGAVTDDTRLTLTVADAIIEKGRMITSDELLKFWKDYPEFGCRKFLVSYRRDEGYWIGEHLAAWGGRLGIPGHLTGYLNFSSLFAGNEAAMMMAPVGILFRGRPESAARAALELSRVCIVGQGAEMASSWAAAIAEALSDGGTVESVLEVATQYASTRIRPYIEKALEVAAGFTDVYEARHFLYMRCLKAIAIDSRETVPMAFAMFKIASGDPMTAIRGGANFGRDSDTIAGMAGLLSGALTGVSSIDRGILETVCDVNGLDIQKYAAQLADVNQAM